MRKFFALFFASLLLLTLPVSSAATSNGYLSQAQERTKEFMKQWDAENIVETEVEALAESSSGPFVDFNGAKIIFNKDGGASVIGVESQEEANELLREYMKSIKQKAEEKKKIEDAAYNKGYEQGYLDAAEKKAKEEAEKEAPIEIVLLGVMSASSGLFLIFWMFSSLKKAGSSQEKNFEKSFADRLATLPGMLLVLAFTAMFIEGCITSVAKATDTGPYAKNMPAEIQIEYINNLVEVTKCWECKEYHSYENSPYGLCDGCADEFILECQECGNPFLWDEQFEDHFAFCPGCTNKIFNNPKIEKAYYNYWLEIWDY